MSSCFVRASRIGSDGTSVMLGKLEWRDIRASNGLHAFAVFKNEKDVFTNETSEIALGLSVIGPSGPFIWPAHGIEIIKEDRPKCQAFLDTDPNQCYRCDGDGKVYGPDDCSLMLFTCPDCKGSGKNNTPNTI